MLASLLLLFACAPGPLPSGDMQRPDIVLISVDTLRADHLASWGYDRQTSPFIDGLAASGVRFAQTRSPAPWTLPSHVTMLTGRLQPRTLVVEDDIRLADDLPRLPEVLSEKGYHAGGFVSTLYVSRKYGFEKGFERFEDFGLETSAENLLKTVPASKVVDKALAWVGSVPAGEPVFLFVHLYDVHYPYRPPKAYQTMFARAPTRKDPVYRNYAYYQKHPLSAEELDLDRAWYDGAIRYADSQLERLKTAFDAAGRSVTWAVTADHGEEFGERGSWGHAHTLNPEQLHVPWVMAGPGIPAGRTVEVPVGLQDVAPTLAGRAGGVLLDPDGLDLGPYLTSGAPPERPLFAETSRFGTHRYALLDGGWRLDLDLKEDARALYDTRVDPGEMADLAASQPERVAAMEQQVLAWVGTPWTARAAVHVESRTGWFVQDGKLVKRRTDLGAGERFQVLPLDAPVQIKGRKRPYRATGDDRPAPDAPLAFEGVGAGAASLTQDQREKLEKLGYAEPE